MITDLCIVQTKLLNREAEDKKWMSQLGCFGISSYLDIFQIISRNETE